MSKSCVNSKIAKRLKRFRPDLKKRGPFYLKVNNIYLKDIMKQKIILASTSPRRKELLRQIGLDFDVAPSDFEEDMSQKLSHKDLAKTLALGKAMAAASKKELLDCEVVLVKMSKLSNKEIDDYIKTGEPLDKAGAFAIQGIGDGVI